MKKDGMEITLSLEQAVSEHRAMWLYLAEKMKAGGSGNLASQREYLKENKMEDIVDADFFCEYVYQQFLECRECPVSGILCSNTIGKDGLYDIFEKEKDPAKRIELAYRIANVKVENI